jgi:hypothetical protein
VVVFGGVMLIVAGAFQAILGLVALLNSSYYVVTRQGLAFTMDYTAWGWVHLVLGALAVLAGIGVLGGRTWARILGINLAVLAILVNLAFIAAYPVWTVTVVVAYVVVIYALAVHGKETRAEADY